MGVTEIVRKRTRIATTHATSKFWGVTNFAWVPMQETSFPSFSPPPMTHRSLGFSLTFSPPGLRLFF